ncbi:hypothetical protein [Croceimicrobium sp.]|uniref:hypothetical protein n=1 Tax=Croceimicrobium sp. TaxID=2828340 RepID=UPI003BAD567A
MSESIIRVKKRQNPFAQIDRSILENGDLSYRAKGVLCYLLSKPDNWETRLKDVINHGTEGRDAVRSAFKELREAGHLILVPIKSESGRLMGRGYEVHEYPISTEELEIRLSGDSEELDSRTPEKPTVGESVDIVIQNLSNSNLSNKEEDKDQFEKKEDSKEFGFSEFWDLYGKKTGRAKCLQKWRRLKKSEKDEILAHLPNFVNSTPDVQYRPNPLTYLNGRRWEDEYLPSSNIRQGQQSFEPHRKRGAASILRNLHESA